MCLKCKQEELYKRWQGTGQPHIFISHVEDFPIPVNSVDEQTEQFQIVWERKRVVKEDVDEQAAMI